ncbi:MAG: hypothetical protein JNM17_00195 [Archangium sp.]|nr:hypothetical protein [Archangium sp.]
MRNALVVVVMVVGSACFQPTSRKPTATPSEVSEWVCGPGNCWGCCKNNECVGGNFEIACGVDGERCAACADDQRCASPGVCMPIPPGETGGSRLPDANPPGNPLPPPNRQRCVYNSSGQSFCN